MIWLSPKRSPPAPRQVRPSRPGRRSFPPQLHIKRIYIDAELESLLRLAPVADAIVVEEQVLSLTHSGEDRYAPSSRPRAASTCRICSSRVPRRQRQRSPMLQKQ